MAKVLSCPYSPAHSQPSTDELDNMLQSLGMDDPDVRSAQVPALMAQMDPEDTGKVTLESFNGVAVGAWHAVMCGLQSAHHTACSHGPWRRR